MPKLTKAQQAEQTGAVDKLREWVKPGDTISTVLRHVTSSGMSRSVSVLLCQDGHPEDVSYWVARALGDKIDQTHGGVKVPGCGMDAGFHLIYNLARTLYPTYHCLGRGDGSYRSSCPSNTHVNHGDDRDDYRPEVVHSDGYSLHHRWV